MATIGPISLFREKTSVHNIGDPIFGTGATKSMTLRSNRVILELMTSHRKEQAVIRGRTIPDTLRLSALVVEWFMRDPQVFHRDAPLEWTDLWGRRRSDYDREFSPESWVSIHVDGHPVFTTQGSEAIDLIENVAAGEDLTDAIIKDATRQLFKSAEDVVVEHESQTAVVFTPFANHLRAAILERRGGRTGSFSVSAFHGPGEKKVRLGTFVGFVADIVEAVTLRELLDRAKAATEGRGPAGNKLPHQQISAALARRRQCAQYVFAFEKGTKVQYRPERPDLGISPN